MHNLVVASGQVELGLRKLARKENCLLVKIQQKLPKLTNSKIRKIYRCQSREYSKTDHVTEADNSGGFAVSNNSQITIKPLCFNDFWSKNEIIRRFKTSQIQFKTSRSL